MEDGARVSPPAATSVFHMVFNFVRGFGSSGIAAGGDTRAPARLWVKTRRDKAFSFRLDTKVVSKYPVKA